MNVTNNLKLPQYTEDDIFDLQDINKAYDSIDKAYGSLDDARKEVVNIKDEIPKTNATAEVISARGNKETLGKRLDEFGSHLDTIENEEIKNIKVPYDYNGAIVTFVVDDCKSTFLDIAKVAFDNKGVKCTLAVVPSWIDTSGYMTMEEIKQLKNEGYEFVSHSYTHSSSIWNTLNGTNDLSNVSDEKIEKDIYQAKKWLIDNNLGDGKTIVYPFGGFGTQSKRFKKLAKKYHENGINAVGGGYNDCPNDNMYLNRYFLNSKSTNVNVVRTMIDNAITNNQLLVIGTHSLESEVYVAYIERIIEYCEEKGVPVLTFSEALKYKGNALSIGDYEDEEKMFVAKNGKVITKQETIENNFTNLSYTINSNWSYKANSSFFWNKGNEYFVNVILEKTTQNGTFTSNEVMISKEIEFTGKRNTLFDAIVVSSTGVVTRVPFWVKLKENKVEISMFDDYTGENDIRWISFNCHFIA